MFNLKNIYSTLGAMLIQLGGGKGRRYTNNIEKVELYSLNDARLICSKRNASLDPPKVEMI